jgi:hypothetical protein
LTPFSISFCPTLTAWKFIPKMWGTGALVPPRWPRTRLDRKNGRQRQTRADLMHVE